MKIKYFIMIYVCLICVFFSANHVEAKKKDIKLSKSSITLKVGESVKLKLKKVPKKKVKWKSANNEVAVVKKGKVTAKNAGKTVITAVYKDKKYRCKTTVVTGETKSSDSVNIEDLVKAQVNGVTTSGSSISLEVSITNNTKEEFRFGRDFFIERLSDGNWVRITTSVENPIEAVVVVIPAGIAHVSKYKMDNIKEQLTPGSYRFIIPDSTILSNKEKYPNGIICEFAIR